MTELEFDNLVTCISGEHLGSWSDISRSIVRNLSVKNFTVICPDEIAREVERISAPEFKIKRESDFDPNLQHNLRERLSKEHNLGRYGWYLQQFLKLEFIKNHLSDDNILIWDSDTLPMKTIRFKSPSGQHMFYRSSEYHLEYFRAIYKLTGLDKIENNSFVTQCLPVDVKKLRPYFLEWHESDGEWFSDIFDAIDFSQASGFSEYELLGTILSHSEEGHILLRHEKWTRNGTETYGDPSTALKLKSSEFDFIAFEAWQSELPSERRKKIILSRAKFVARKSGLVTFFDFLRKRHFIYLEKKTKSFLSKVFASGSLHVVQIGSNDGVSNDPLWPFFQENKTAPAVLVEPIPEYAEALRNNHSDRPRTSVINAAAGNGYGERPLYYFDQAVASEMDGNGPQNLWATGQGSFDRCLVVWWVHQNAWRWGGERAKTERFISQIKMLNVDVRRTSEFLVGPPDETLLVIDVQGPETEVISGLRSDSLPKWVICESDSPRFDSPFELLESLGYRKLVGGANSCFVRESA